MNGLQIKSKFHWLESNIIFILHDLDKIDRQGLDAFTDLRQLEDEANAIGKQLNRALVDISDISESIADLRLKNDMENGETYDC